MLGLREEMERDPPLAQPGRRVCLGVGHSSNASELDMWASHAERRFPGNRFMVGVFGDRFARASCAALESASRRAPLAPAGRRRLFALGVRVASSSHSARTGGPSVGPEHKRLSSPASPPARWDTTFPSILSKPPKPHGLISRRSTIRLKAFPPHVARALPSGGPAPLPTRELLCDRASVTNRARPADFGTTRRRFGPLTLLFVLAPKASESSYITTRKVAAPASAHGAKFVIQLAPVTTRLSLLFPCVAVPSSGSSGFAGLGIPLWFRQFGSSVPQSRLLRMQRARRGLSEFSLPLPVCLAARSSSESDVQVPRPRSGLGPPPSSVV